jgi:hypothetical protein
MIGVPSLRASETPLTAPDSHISHGLLMEAGVSIIIVTSLCRICCRIHSSHCDPAWMPPPLEWSEE